MPGCGVPGPASFQANCDKRRRPTDPATFDEYMARTDVARSQKAALRLLQEIIDNERVGPAIFDMHWSRVSLAASSLPLLTSDRPLYIPFGVAEPDAQIALPIGPRMLFVACRDAALAKDLAAADPTKVVRSMNLEVVSSARKFVWGVDDSQLCFVRNRMSTAPEKQIISDEQKQQGPFRSACHEAVLGRQRGCPPNSPAAPLSEVRSGPHQLPQARQ
jgi:hypothetical protein